MIYGYNERYFDVKHFLIKGAKLRHFPPSLRQPSDSYHIHYDESSFIAFMLCKNVAIPIPLEIRSFHSVKQIDVQLGNV